MLKKGTDVVRLQEVIRQFKRFRHNHEKYAKELILDSLTDRHLEMTQDQEMADIEAENEYQQLFGIDVSDTEDND